MKIATYEQIVREIQQSNIFPITSECNIKCEFCSHKNNPDNIDTYKLPKLTREELIEFIEYLSTDKKIVIGESASRIVEGEPFIHKDFMYILKKIREKYKATLIQITSNGSFFTENTIQKLSGLQPLEINLSLNSSSFANRKLLINDSHPEIAINSCSLLNKYKIKYNGSLVAMPHIVGWQDIEDSIIFLCQNNCDLVRIFIPGFTKYSNYSFNLIELYEKTNEIVNKVRKYYDTPIIIEPPIIKSLDAVIEGVIKNSPAEKVKIKQDDIIKKVSEIDVVSRVHAYNLAFKAKNPIIEFLRDDNIFTVSLMKEANCSSGFVMLYDIDPDISHIINNLIKRKNAIRPLIITSELAYDMLSVLLTETLNDIDYRILPIKNEFFGGSIMVSGLLIVEDIINQIKGSCLEFDSDLIILPSSPFDYFGKDLTGKYYGDIEEKFDIPTCLI